MKTGKLEKAIAVLELVTAAGLLAFWALFFTVGLEPADAPACYMAFERSFPLPDIVLSCALLCAGVLLLRGRPVGRSLSLVCAGALVFLGLLDFSFNIQNGIYTSSPADAAMSAFINIWCVASGVFVAVALGKRLR